MAQLYFRYGAMGASKTANALMVRYNYEERGQEALMVKPRTDQREGKAVIRSRIGLEHPCMYFDEFAKMPAEKIQEFQCVIVDEAQFLSKNEVRFLTYVVDIYNVPVICYGLRMDFKGDLFPGSAALLAMADKIEEVKTICWCGKKATCNARFDKDGTVLKEGEQVVLGANDQYVGLCRKHWVQGNIGPQKDLLGTRFTEADVKYAMQWLNIKNRSEVVRILKEYDRGQSLDILLDEYEDDPGY